MRMSKRQQVPPDYELDDVLSHHKEEHRRREET